MPSIVWGFRWTPKIRRMKPFVYTRGQALPGILGQRIAILDGAMGTMTQRLRLGEADYRGQRFAEHPRDVRNNGDLLNLTQPRVIQDIHEAYLAAGADIVETNTFGATRVAQADYDMADLAYEMNVAAARIARAACDSFSTSRTASRATTLRTTVANHGAS